MPYASISELPEGVRNNVPKHGQEIYKEAFNSAIKEHDEKTAHKIAWSAVKSKYKKTNGSWKKKKSWVFI